MVVNSYYSNAFIGWCFYYCVTSFLFRRGSAFNILFVLTFIEMMMIGVPIVALGRELHGCHKVFKDQHSYEVPDIIKNGYNGFVSDNISELRQYIKMLLNRESVRAQISDNARRTAIELFDRNKTMKGWDNFLKSL